MHACRYIPERPRPPLMIIHKYIYLEEQIGNGRVLCPIYNAVNQREFPGGRILYGQAWIWAAATATTTTEILLVTHTLPARTHNHTKKNTQTLILLFFTQSSSNSSFWKSWHNHSAAVFSTWFRWRHRKRMRPNAPQTGLRSPLRPPPTTPLQMPPPAPPVNCQVGGRPVNCSR